MGLAAATTPLVSVIIPVKDDVDGLRKCLDALAAQTYPNFEILVVDNASSADIAAVTNGRKRVRVLRELEPGSYAARNAGLAEAKGEIFAFTDADCVPARNWLTSGVEAMCGDKHIVIGGPVRVVRSSRDSSLWQSYDMLTGFPQDFYIRSLHFSVTANLFVFKRTIEQIGPFNPSLSSSGDLEFGQRAHVSGIAVEYAPAAQVTHPARNRTELIAKARRIGRGRRELHNIERRSLPERCVYAAKLIMPSPRTVRRIFRSDVEVPWSHRLGGVIIMINLRLNHLRSYAKSPAKTIRMLKGLL